MKLSIAYWILAVLTTALSWDQQGFTTGQTVIIMGFMILSRIEYHAERREGV